MAIDAQQLQQLVETPSERLDVELKAWLDLSDNGPRGTLAKGLIALANHGGGVAIIGFDTDGNPAPNRPTTLAAYSQDAINDVVDRFAEPGFHCTVHRVTRAVDGLQYPVILVPGGHKAPIRSKRGAPNNEILADRYYIRRPGPASEMPQGGHEWDELIRRCVRNNTDEIASLVRDVLEGRAPKAEAPPDAAARLAQWDAASMARWTTLLEALPPNSHVRMPHGHYRVACAVDGIALDLPRLREVMQRAAQHLTGWRRGDSDSGISQSKHSRRIVPMTRSQMELAIGLRGGNFNTVIPSRPIDSSRCLAKMLSRSCSRYS
jgi:hypothetical protein